MRNYSSVATEKTLVGNVSNSATQITLSDSTGLPSVPFTLVLNPDTSIEEIITVNSDQSGVVAPTYKVTRGQDGTSAQNHTSGNTVKHMVTGRDLQDAQDHIAATTGHGATGAVVGTTNSQTLTNKTLTSPIINSPTINSGSTLTATSTELNKLAGVTATTAEINKLAGLTATTSELNKLAGTPAGLTSTELGYVDGVTSSIQTQLDAKQAASTNGLVLVKSQSISSSVSSVTVTSAFSTTYENYKIIIHQPTFSTAASLKLTFGSSITNYYQGILGVGFDGIYADFTSGATYFYIGGSAANISFTCDINVFGPYLSSYTGVQSSYIDYRTTAGWGFNLWGNHATASSYTDFTIATTAGTISGGTIYVYGYKK